MSTINLSIKHIIQLYDSYYKLKPNANVQRIITDIITYDTEQFSKELNNYFDGRENPQLIDIEDGDKSVD